MVSKTTGAMVDVYAAKGPLAGSKVQIPEEDVEGATGESGWAIKIEPGNQLLADPGAPYDTSWKIPGYTAEMLQPFTGNGGTEKPTAKSELAANGTQQNAGSSKTSDAATATASKDEGGEAAAAPKPTATKTSTK